MNPSIDPLRSSRPLWPTLWPTALGVSAFLLMQFGLALHQLASTSGSMMNKFSALARDQYLGFLIQQNLWMLLAYGLLAVVATMLALPVVYGFTQRSKFRHPLAIACRAFALAAIFHGFAVLRLVETRPYFLSKEEFGQWYFKVLTCLPASSKPTLMFLLFTGVPIVFLAGTMLWYLGRRARRVWVAALGIALAVGTGLSLQSTASRPSARPNKNTSPNILIIASDSLRGDRLGCAGYQPARRDGAAAAGTSPAIDQLARRSTRFERCYTSIASTMESGVQLMASEYPQSHGLRQMYPDRATVEATRQRVVPLATLLRERGYDTAAIGDWCAGYYEVIPLGFEHISVSSFDNFKIYMSQAVVLAHFVVPLYFDNRVGYWLYPQLQAFAQFVTPQVVTDRVEQRLESTARKQQPFFWHVFFSCNHLPYRSPQPYLSMFADPAYQGRNRNGVDFDVDSFIGGTDLESKWKALPPKEIDQIRALYDGCTREFDDCVARILASLERNGLADNTIVIITADHGDDLYEPGVTLGHGLTFNGGLHANHVPMIVHVPGQSAKVIPETVRLIDVVPTLADLTNTKPSPTWQGQSFAPWIRGTAMPESRPFYGETGFPFIQFSVPGVKRLKLPPMDVCTRIDESYNYQFVLKPEYQKPLVNAKQRCLRTDRWKLVLTPTEDGGRHFGLFHLPGDPYGESNLATTRPDVLTPMRQALEAWVDQQIETPIHKIFPAGEP